MSTKLLSSSTVVVRFVTILFDLYRELRCKCQMCYTAVFFTTCTIFYQGHSYSSLRECVFKLQGNRHYEKKRYLFRHLLECQFFPV